MKYVNSLLISVFLAASVVQAQPEPQSEGRPVDIPSSKHVKSIHSGGDPRSYTDDIKWNQHRFARQRGIDYHFHDLSQKDSPVMNTLNGKQKYWAKIVILQQAMEDNSVPEGSWVAWVDDDIVINDVNKKATMMDRVIEKYGQDKSVIVAREDSDWAYLNTGIMLIKKDQGGRDVLTNLIQKSKRHEFGMQDQSKSFHEQGALKELYLERKGLERHVAVVAQRDGELNFNNFRRFSHVDDSRLVDTRIEVEENGSKVVKVIKAPIKLVYDDSDSARAKDSDAFIHHTGMKQSLRDQLIKTTILASENPEAVQSMPILISGMKTDKELDDESKKHRNDIRKERLADRERKLGVEAVLDKYFPKKTCYLLSDKEKEAREEQIRKDAAKIRNAKNRGVLVSKVLTDDELREEQKAHRKAVKAAALAKRDEERKLGEEEHKSDDADAEPVVENQPETGFVEPIDYFPVLRARLLSEVSESTEQSILELESLNQAASMMALMAMTSLSSTMSGFRAGSAFSYGLTSIDDVPSDALASIHPSAQNRIINRDVGSWHNFVQLNMLQGNRKAVDGLPGSSVKGHGLTTGVFYQLDEQLIVGMMLSLGKTHQSLKKSGGSGSIESITLGPFISYSLNDWHLDAALTYGSDSYEMKRRDVHGSEYKSGFSGNTLTGYLGFGYDIHLESLSPFLTLTPMVELIHSRISHESYQEKHSQGKGMKVGNSSSHTTVSRFGLELSYLMPDMDNPMELKIRTGLQHQSAGSHKTGYELPFGMLGQLTTPGSSERSLFTGLALHRRLGKGNFAFSYTGTHSSVSSSHGLQLEYERGF